MRYGRDMDRRTLALIERIERLRLQSQSLGGALNESASGRRLQRRWSAAATEVDRSYRAASTAGSGDAFILHVSAAARQAKRARQTLQDLTQMGYASIETTRELILEARGIEAILTASRNTAKRRRAAAGGGRFAKNPSGAGRHAKP